MRSILTVTQSNVTLKSGILTAEDFHPDPRWGIGWVLVAPYVVLRMHTDNTFSALNDSATAFLIKTPLGPEGQMYYNGWALLPKERLTAPKRLKKGCVDLIDYANRVAVWARNLEQKGLRNDPQDWTN